MKNHIRVIAFFFLLFASSCTASRTPAQIYAKEHKENSYQHNADNWLNDAIKSNKEIIKSKQSSPKQKQVAQSELERLKQLKAAKKKN